LVHSDVFKHFLLPGWMLVNVPDDSHVDFNVVWNQVVQRCFIVTSTSHIIQGNSKAFSAVNFDNSGFI